MPKQIDMFVEASDRLQLKDCAELQAIADALPSEPTLSVYEICRATGVQDGVVYGWIESGKFTVINTTSKTKARWRVFRASFLEFLKTRIIPGGGRR